MLSAGYTTVNYISLCLRAVRSDLNHRLIHPVNISGSAFEAVEQLYQKSIEVKPTPQEPSRPRSIGRPLRKEYPAFDINPRVARAFLTRLKAWKEEDAVNEQRDFISEKENHGAVEFQEPNEQYTPWKDLEIEEETPEPVMDRPTTWAEALRRKQNLANGISDSSESPKGEYWHVSFDLVTDNSCSGPVKPKLVARAPGSDSSPWKIKKDAPKVSAKDVPGALRPLMSCALWRLHESIHRNDANQLFFFTDQPEIRSVAQKLNIFVRSIADLKALVASKADKSDTAIFGDLEREFGLQKHDEKTEITELSGEERIVEEGQNATSKQIEVTDAPMPSSDFGRVDDSRSIDKDSQIALKHHNQEPPGQNPGEENFSPAKGSAIGNPPAENIADASTVTLVESRIPKVSAWSRPLTDLVSRTNRDSTEKRSEGAHEINAGNLSELDRPTSTSALERESPKAIETPLRSLSPAITSSEEEAASSVQPETAPQIGNHAILQPNESETPSSLTTQDLEDSDEEEIVFKPQPKRYSAQKKPPQQVPRPSTPKSQPPQNLEERSPQVSTLTSQPKPKLASHGRNPLVIGHGHPQPKGSPTVIDPDAFGRNFVVNTNPSPRTLNNAQAHHYTRPRSSHGPSPQLPRSNRRHEPRLSPPRNYQEPASRESPASEPKFEPKAEPVARTSPRRTSRVIEPEKAASRDAQIKAPGPDMKSSLPAPKSLETNEFVPRSPSANMRLANTRPIPSMNRSKDYLSADFGPRSQKSQSEAKPEASVPGPKTIDTTEFIPRSAMTTPLYKPRAPEPEYIEPRASMPEVEYVLKSGTTRASARGRGRLWTPS